MDDSMRKAVGTAAEQAAFDFLLARGLKPITRNYRCRGGELDIVMLDGKTLAFVEVRFRATSNFGGAADSVTWHKQRRIIFAARHFLMTHRGLSHLPGRFDIVAIDGNIQAPRIEWLKAAFTADR
ncbi:MAG TPA: YraN family protein [Steroidobacteraceae bacterium]